MKHKRGGFLGLAASLDHPQRAVGGNVTFILRVPIKWMDEENKRMGDFLSAEAGREFPCPSAKGAYASPVFTAHPMRAVRKG